MPASPVAPSSPPTTAAGASGSDDLRPLNDTSWYCPTAITLPTESTEEDLTSAPPTSSKTVSRLMTAFNFDLSTVMWTVADAVLVSPFLTSSTVTMQVYPFPARSDLLPI